MTKNHSFKATFKRMNGPQSQEGEKKSTEKDIESGGRRIKRTESIKGNRIPECCSSAREVS